MNISAMGLVVNEAGYGAPGSGELCSPNEIACFVAGPSQWRETIRKLRNKFPSKFEGLGDLKIIKDILSDEDNYDCADIAAKIRENLN
jgi:hypothetical protein